MNFYESCALWFSPKEECESDGVTSAPTNVSIATSMESIEQLEKCGVSKTEIDINHTDGVINKRQESVCKDNDDNINNNIDNEKCNIDDGKNSSSDTIDSHGVGLTDSGGCTPLELFHTAPETRPLMTPLLECVPTSSEITNKESVKTNNSDSVITITKKNNILRNNDSPRNDMNVNDDKHDHCINLKEIKEYSSNAEVISVYESDTETECKTENRYEHNNCKDKYHNKYVNDTINARKSMLLIQYHATHKMIKECSVEDVSEQILSIETPKEEQSQIAEVKQVHQVPESTYVSGSSKVQVKSKEQQKEEEEEEEEANKIGKVSKKLTQSPLCPRPLDYDSPSSEQGSPTNKELSVHSPSFTSTTSLTNDKEKAVNTNNKKFCSDNNHNDDQEEEGIVASTTANTTSSSVHNEVNIKSISSPLLPPCSIDAEDEYDENHDDNSSVDGHVFNRVQDTWHTINCNQAHTESNNCYKSVYGNNTTTVDSTNTKSNEDKTKEIIKPGCNYDAPPFIPNNLLTNNLRRLPSLEQEDGVIIGGNKGQARSISIHNNNNNNKRNLANTKTLNEGNNKNNLIRERNRSYYSRGEGNDDEDDDNDNDNDYNYENKFYNKSFKNYNNSGKLYNSKTNKTTSSFTVNNNSNNINNNTSFSSFTRKRAAATSPSSTSSLSALLTPNETMRYWMNESNNRVASYNKSRRHTDQHTMKMLKETNMGNEMVFQVGRGRGATTTTSSPLPLSSASMPLTRSAGAHVDCYSKFSSFPGYYQDVSATRYANCANKGANSFTRRSRAPIQQSHSLYNKNGRSRHNLTSSAERTNQIEGNEQNYEDDEEVNDDDEDDEGEQGEDVIGLMDQYSMEWPYLYYMNMMNYAPAVMGTYDAYNGVWIPADDIANEYIANMEGVNENIDCDAIVNDHAVVDINVDMNEQKEENKDYKKDEDEEKDASAPCQVSEQHTSCSLSELKDISNNVSHSSFAKQKDTNNEGNSKLDTEKSSTILSTTTHNDSSHGLSTKVEIDETKTQHNSHWSETIPSASTELIPPEPLEPYEMEEDNINMHTTNTTYSSLQESNSTNININNNNNTIKSNIKTNNNFNIYSSNNNIQFGNNSNVSSFNYNGHVDQRSVMPATETSNMIKPAAVQLNPVSVFNNYMYNNNNYNQNLNNGGGVLQQPTQLLTPFNGQCYSAGANMNNSNCGSCSNINSTFVSPPSVHLPSMQTSTSTEINVGDLASIQFVPYAPQPIDATEYQIRNLSLPTYLSSSCNSVNSSFVSGSGRQASSQRWHRHDPYNLTSVLPNNSYNTPPANSRQCSASVSTPHLRIESPRLTRKIPSNVTFKFHDPIKRMSSLRLRKQE